MPSLDYYLVIDQDTVTVEVYSREENGWHYQLLEDLSDKVALVLFDMSLSLDTIYENISFTKVEQITDDV